MELYTNGTILTMAEPETAEAVLTDKGKIIAVGGRQELIEMEPDAELIDLQEKTMMPAFLDAHSHFSSYASSFLQVELGESKSFEEIVERVHAFIEKNQIRPGEWVTGKGYDHNVLIENRHPTLACADLCAPKNPLILQHASGHVGVFNSRALDALGITPETPSPEGGRIEAVDGVLTGYMEENAFFTFMKMAPMAGMEAMLHAYEKAQDSYAAHGITTIQEGMTVSQMIPLYEMLLEKQMLYLDVVAYAAMPDAKNILDSFPESIRKYDRHFKIGGMKIFLDGSPQGRTAWMRTPYQNEEPPYYGYGTRKDEEVLSAVKEAAEKELQILAHCNGDAAAQQYLDAVSQAAKQRDVAVIRPVMIHAQLLGLDQLPKVKSLGIIPSFFIAHVYHWGDTHIKNFGRERASVISPAASALDQGILFTFHQDTPVIEPDMLETVWCAVNRRTRKGVLLGEAERIDVRDALKAVTIHAAYQYFEEDKKGSMEAGKCADFVLLDKNPLAVDPMEIRDIQVMQTIKCGKTIYEKK